VWTEKRHVEEIIVCADETDVFPCKMIIVELRVYSEGVLVR
jgi:hypothetical protein